MLCISIPKPWNTRIFRFIRWIPSLHSATQTTIFHHKQHTSMFRIQLWLWRVNDRLVVLGSDHFWEKRNRYITIAVSYVLHVLKLNWTFCKCDRVQLKRDGTRWRTAGEVKGKLANGVGSQSPSHRFTLPRNLVYPALLPLMRTPRLPAIDWTDAPADLNGLVSFAERPNLVSARVPSHFKRTLATMACWRTVFPTFCSMNILQSLCNLFFHSKDYGGLLISSKLPFNNSLKHLIYMKPGET